MQTDLNNGDFAKFKEVCKQQGKTEYEVAKEAILNHINEPNNKDKTLIRKFRDFLNKDFQEWSKEEFRL